MATSFLTAENFSKNWEASKLYMEDLRKPFDEFERVKNNRPHPDIDPMYPKTTDGTTASQIRLTPRRSVQQVPYGEVEVDGDEALSCLANYLLRDEIIPHSDTQDEVLGKTWKGIEDIQTYGSTDALVFYKVEGDYFGTDWRVPYKKDIYLEAGKGTFSECTYLFVRAWYQDSDIQAIIDKEASMKAASEERGDKYKASWDIQVLQKLLDEGSKKEKDEKLKTDSEKDLGIKTRSFELVHGYQKGKGAKFFTFAPDVDKMARDWPNPDPRGVMPVERMYFEQDHSNPEGRGIVELVAPLQNFLDSSLQAYQYVRALMYNPPLLKKGNYNRSQIQYYPNAIIDLGVDPNSSLTPLNLNTTAMGNFSNDFGLIKSQILNLFGGDDQTVSSTVGNPGFSKTDAGVNARQAIIGVNDNFIRKRVEAWLGRVFCTQINLYFAITQGDRVFTPSEDELAKLAEYGENDYYTIDGNQLIVHFSNINDKEFNFETEASTSKAPDTNESKEHLLEAIKTLGEMGLGQYVNPQEVTQRILINAGVDDPEKLLVDPQEQMAQEQMAQGDDPEAQQVIQNLIDAGYPEELAMQAYQLEKQGYAPEQIDEWIKQQGAQ